MGSRNKVEKSWLELKEREKNWPTRRVQQKEIWNGEKTIASIDCNWVRPAEKGGAGKKTNEEKNQVKARKKFNSILRFMR